MDFENVFNYLREIFPEYVVDHRILRVVALENPYNVDAAIDYVFTEVIPRLCEDNLSSASHYPWVDNVLATNTEHAVENETRIESLRHEPMDMDSSESDSTDSEISLESSVAYLNAPLNLSVSVNNFTASFALPASIQEDISEVGMNQVAPGTSNGLVHEEICQLVNPVTEDIKRDTTQIDEVDGSSSSVQSDHEISNANGTSSLGFKQECSNGETSVTEDGLMGHSIITQSGQPCNIDLLDEIIEDAKEYKMNLFSVMESVINEMKDLEHKEKYVEKVKEETANIESEIVSTVEEMKQTVVHSMEAHDMFAGEVYGEKAILATETRELQSRLVDLSNERDESLSTLAEMHTTLKERMAAVDDMLKAAEEEKLVKEEQACKELAKQEALIEMVAQESTILRQKAEENSKLREFLNHRGQLVDLLQGEISVICQDVRLLKEKFDLEVPLSRSISSSQTSCILASLGSSYKSAASDEVRFSLPLKDIVPSNLDAKKGTSSNSRIEGSRASSVSSSSLSPDDLEEERGRNHFNAFSDDGWEIFDKDAELAETQILWMQKKV